MVGVGAIRSRSTEVIELMVLIRLTASVPPFFAARAGLRISVTFGVSLVITGMREYCLHQRTTISTYSGTRPTAAPMPRSLIPCGQPKLSSMPSTPVSSTSGRMAFQASSSHGTMIEAITARSGQRILTAFISWRFFCRSRSVISSMLLNPISRRSPAQIAP